VVNQICQQVEDVRHRGVRKDRGRRGRAERCGEHTEARERLLLVAAELRDTPAEGYP
jgi:hypothetical protein